MNNKYFLALIGFSFSLTHSIPANLAYLTYQSGSVINIIDTDTNSITGTIWAGDGAWEQVMSVDGNKLYVVNYISNSVSVIDTGTNSVVATISVGITPVASAIHPTRPLLFVTNNQSYNVSVIDTYGNIGAGMFPTGPLPQYFTITPDGQTGYVSCFGSEYVCAIDLNSFTPITTIEVGDFPQKPVVVTMSVFDQDQSVLLVPNSLSNNVSVIDVVKNTKLYSFPVGTFPNFIGVSPDGAMAYVTNQGSAEITAFNLSLNNYNSIPVNDRPTFLAISPDSNTVYVSHNQNNLEGVNDIVTVIDVPTLTVKATIEVGGLPRIPVFSNDGATLYIPNSLTQNISVIDPATNLVITTIDLTNFPYQIVMESTLTPEERERIKMDLW